MVPKTSEEKKSNTVANTPNRKRSRWRDGSDAGQRKRPNYDPDHDDPVGRRQPDNVYTPAKEASDALLRVHYNDSDRKRELDTRYARSPDAMTPMSLHSYAMMAANAPRGEKKKPTKKKDANEELGDAAYDPADEPAIAAHLKKANDAWMDKKLEDEQQGPRDPAAFSPVGVHAASLATANAFMVRKQRGTGHERSMLAPIGSMSGLDYGHSRNRQGAALFSWEN